MFNIQELQKLHNLFYNHIVKRINYQERKDILKTFFDNNPKITYKLKNYIQYITESQLKTSLNRKTKKWNDKASPEVIESVLNRILYYYLTNTTKINTLDLYTQIPKSYTQLLIFLFSRELRDALRLVDFQHTLTKQELLGMFNEHYRQEILDTQIVTHKTKQIHPNIPVVAIANLRVPHQSNKIYYVYTDSFGEIHTNLNGTKHRTYLHHIQHILPINEVLIGFTEYYDADFIPNRFNQYKQTTNNKRYAYRYIYHHLASTQNNIQFELFKRGEHNKCSLFDPPFTPSVGNIIILHYSNFRPLYTSMPPESIYKKSNYIYQFTNYGIFKQDLENTVHSVKCIEWVTTRTTIIKGLKIRLGKKTYILPVRLKQLKLSNEDLKFIDINKSKADVLVSKLDGNVVNVEFLKLKPNSLKFEN